MNEKKKQKKTKNDMHFWALRYIHDSHKREKKGKAYIVNGPGRLLQRVMELTV